MGSELEEVSKKKKKPIAEGLCRTREQAKQENELSEKVEFPSLELSGARGGGSLLQVV